MDSTDVGDPRHNEPALTYGSVFSGIEGFGLGFQWAGFNVLWQVESDPFCRAVLERHWPNAKRYNDIREVGKEELEQVHCITAGVPCQDVSVAGKRRGLGGSRTGLFFEFARILQELRPPWFVFENVPGLFSSNGGRDFAEVLRVLMVECGYGVSWRVLDSRYFNVAQRRERVFIIGRLGEPCPPEILFEPESGGGDPETCGSPREDIAVPLTSSACESRPGRRLSDDFNIVRQPVSAKWAKRTSVPAGDEYHNLIAFDTTQLTHPENRANPRPGEPCHSLSAGAHAPTVAFPLRTNPDNNSDGRSVNLAYTLGSHHRQVRAENGNYVAVTIGTPTDADGVRDFAELPEGMDSARYRALGNAVTATVAFWIAERILRYESRRSDHSRARHA